MVTIFDHTYLPWAKNSGSGNNGAVTYSKDIVAFQIPKWKQFLPKDLDVIISTAPRFSHIERKDVKLFYDVAIQYLHTYPYKNALQYIEEIVKNKPFVATKMYFLSAYLPFVKYLNSVLGDDIEAVYVPMSINTNVVPTINANASNRMMYFGNLYMNKHDAFEIVRKTSDQIYLHFDHIAFNKFNDTIEIYSQDGIWHKIRQYKFGAGVGRCALEMMAMGLQVVICGQKFGGIMLNEQDFQRQREVNMNGRIITTDRDPLVCLSLRNEIYIPDKESFNIGNENHCLYLNL